MYKTGTNQEVKDGSVQQTEREEQWLCSAQEEGDEQDCRG